MENGCGVIRLLNWLPKLPAATLLKSLVAWRRWRSRFRHLARRFLNQICNGNVEAT